MGKRPVSLTIIAWFLIVVSVLGIAGIIWASMSADMAAKMAEQSHVPLWFQQLWTVIGALVTLAVAYGILKGQPWSRVLYIVWGVIGIVVGFLIGTSMLGILFSFILLVVIGAFLFGDRANEWFDARGFALKREGR